MICANCATENRPGRHFCLSCGTALGLACPNCGAENEAEARFCGRCGHALAGPTDTAAGGPAATGEPAQHPGPAAERRLVSVLFADLVGFTPFAEERDAEDVRNTLERYAAVARETVTRYGGTIEKFIGDAVMAVWGTPVAHEDDAERAVRAALELVDSVAPLGPGIQARAGVLTGEAAVSLSATDQGMLAGDLVNSAARLQSVAPPGSVLVGESTMRAASAAVSFEPAGVQALKGKQAPIPAWRALRVVAQRGGAGRAETLETPFVGRDEEFRLLRDHLHLTSRDPRLRLASVTGAAGIGKSRLAWELEKYIDGVVEPIYWHRGRCPAYGEGVSFWALGEMVRSRARLAEADDEQTTRARIAATVAEYVADESERSWIEQALLVLLGVEQQAQSGRETLFAAWRRLFESIATRGTTVLVFEDLHWADDGLLDFIDHLLDWSKSAPLLVVTLARPELFDRRPDWGAGRRTFTALALDPLPASAMREMLTALVPELPERAMNAIVERADGIPLYAVETVRMLVADGRLIEAGGSYRPTGELGDLQVPDSLRSLITSRLDALEVDDRRLLQDASVLGQSFTPPALAAVGGSGPGEVEPRLRGLVRRELLTLEADPRSPERGQYAFMQSLIREVAYSTLARPERRQRHLAAARHYEETGGDELAGVLAGHYVAAHEASAAGAEADAVAAQARVALRAAAERAAALGGHRQAVSYLEQALAVTTNAVDRAHLLERQAHEADLSGRYEQAEAAARAAIEHYREIGDATGLARSLGVLGTALIHASRIPDALAVLEPALAELPDDADPAVRADVLAKLARVHYRNLMPERSIEMADQALLLAEHHRLRRTLAEALVSKASALSFLARPAEALVLMRGGMEIARREGDFATMLRAAANLPGLISIEEGPPQGLAVSRQALDTARTIGDLGQIVWQMGGVLLGAAFAGESLEQVLAEADEVMAMDLEASDRNQLIGRMIIPAGMIGRDVEAMVAEYVTSVDVESEPQAADDVLWYHAYGAAVAGDHETAIRVAVRTAEVRPEFGTMALAALLSAMEGRVDHARQYLEQAAGMPVVGRNDEALRVAARAAVLALEGRRDEALAPFRESLRMQREMGSVLEFGLVALAMLRVLGPDSDEARASGEEALVNFERMGAGPMAEQILAALGRSTAGAAGAPADSAGADAPSRTAEGAATPVLP